VSTIRPIRPAEARTVRTSVSLDAPWTGEELAFWTSLGFEHDQTARDPLLPLGRELPIAIR